MPAVVEVAGPAEDVKMVEERGEEGALAAEDGTPAQGTSSSKKKKSKGKKKNK